MHVLFFAKARVVAGTSHVDVPLEGASGTVGSVMADVVRQLPALESLVPRCRLALNEEYCDTADAVKPGDVLACIPPVSGG